MEDPLNKTMALPPADDLTGMHVDRYEIRSRLGTGGMGEVYLAEDTKLMRAVALKQLAPQLRSNPRSHVLSSEKPSALRCSTIRISLRSTTSGKKKAKRF
jgi:serine/threonine protein kinase